MLARPGIRSTTAVSTRSRRSDLIQCCPSSFLVTGGVFIAQLLHHEGTKVTKVTKNMEVRSLQGSLQGFGAKPAVAYIELNTLTLADRVKRAVTIFGLAMVLALIAIPIPLVHFVLVPGALLVGAVLAAVRLRQAEIFRSATGRCPFCGTEQSFSVIGRFRLPKTLHCSSCQRQLILNDPTIVSRHSPT